MERRKASLLILLLLAILSVGAWQLFRIQSKQDIAAASIEVSTQQVQKNTLVSIDLPLELRHSVKGGVHTYSGTISLPNACDVIASGIQTQGVNPTHLRIQLASEKMPCHTESETQNDFSVSFSGGTRPPVLDAVIFNGMELPYTVLEDK
ncbi:hypothetical protein K2Q08_02465 [Patescibacteria group bacterium]|nr:hypothetical protein [Patescibacteria group bacterium]